jgi:ech hydrogenase subunit E
VLGGVKFDVDSAHADGIRHGLDFLEQRTRHYLDVVTSDETLLRRTRGVGVMTAEQAERLSVVGPTARASGLARDLRIEAPYAAYADYPVAIVTEAAGDLEARFVVRIKELFESYRVIRQILDTLPTGELTARMLRKVKAGETISRVEAPRGELFYFIKSNGSERPERIRVATPTIRNLTAALALVVGHHLADVPMILAGVDPCFSCNDRAVIVNQPGRDHAHWNWEELRQRGIDYYSGQAVEKGRSAP